MRFVCVYKQAATFGTIVQAGSKYIQSVHIVYNKGCFYNRALILKYRRRSQEGEERIRDAATRRRGETQRRSNKKEMRDSETQQQEGEERLRDAATRGRGET